MHILQIVSLCRIKHHSLCLHNLISQAVLIDTNTRTGAWQTESGDCGHSSCGQRIQPVIYCALLYTEKITTGNISCLLGTELLETNV